MSIWGSLIGGMVGFSLGGPFGMLLGSLIGGKISRARSGSTGNFGAFAQPQQIFALSLIVLSAKLSKADGQVSKEELIAVRDKLKIPESEIEQVGKIFNKAKQESTGYEPYAQQIAQIYKNNQNVLEEVINILFYIAEADGNVSKSELDMIQHIAQIFGLNQSQFNSIQESRKSSDKLNPYVVLGSNPEEDIQTIRKKYLQLSKENHPDMLISKGVPKEVIEESKKKMRAINSAWDQIQKLKNN
jgi:DnaJ like chaperone protein